MFEAELEASGVEGAVGHTTAIHQSWVQGCLEKQRIDSVLSKKFSDIQVFIKKADKGQELTQALIQHNFFPKCQLLPQRKEVDAYISKNFVSLNANLLSTVFHSLRENLTWMWLSGSD